MCSHSSLAAPRNSGPVNDHWPAIRPVQCCRCLRPLLLVEVQRLPSADFRCFSLPLFRQWFGDTLRAFFSDNRWNATAQPQLPQFECATISASHISCSHITRNGGDAKQRQLTVDVPALPPSFDWHVSAWQATAHRMNYHRALTTLVRRSHRHIIACSNKVGPLDCDKVASCMAGRKFPLLVLGCHIAL